MLARTFILFWVALVSVALSYAQSSAKTSHRRKAAGQKSEKKTEGKKSPGDIAEGKAIYEKRCSLCHLATSDEPKVGPGLKGLGKREKFKEGQPITDDSLRAWIENGGKGMPGFKTVLTSDELRDLIAYLKTL